MITRGIDDPLHGEHLLRVAPSRGASSDKGWRTRLNLETGRSLSADALTAEQVSRSGQIATLGRTLSRGIIHGLGAAIDVDGNLCVEPGTGITATGEIVRLGQQVCTGILDLQVLTDDLVARLTEGAAATRSIHILVLQPAGIEAVADADLTDSCLRDPASDSVERRIVVDGARLGLVPWDEAPSFSTRWRSDVAWAIFNQERGFAEDAVHPWEKYGVPIAVLALDGEGGVDWLDRHMVARHGGRTRSVRPLVEGTGRPALWQAQMEQFAEHVLAETDAGVDTADRELSRQWMRCLPPIGVLPLALIDPRGSFEDPTAMVDRFFPIHIRPLMRPIREGDLDLLLARTSSLQAIALDEPAAVMLSVVVPDSLFDPDLLIVEQPDPAFQEELDRLIELRADLLRRREYLREVLHALEEAAGGPDALTIFPEDDPQALGDEEIALGSDAWEALGTSPNRPSEIVDALLAATSDADVTAILATAWPVLLQWFVDGDTDLQGLLQQAVDRFNAGGNGDLWVFPAATPVSSLSEGTAFEGGLVDGWMATELADGFARIEQPHILLVDDVIDSYSAIAGAMDQALSSAEVGSFVLVCRRAEPIVVHELLAAQALVEQSSALTQSVPPRFAVVHMGSTTLAELGAATGVTVFDNATLDAATFDGSTNLQITGRLIIDDEETVLVSSPLGTDANLGVILEVGADSGDDRELRQCRATNAGALTAALLSAPLETATNPAYWRLATSIVEPGEEAYGTVACDGMRLSYDLLALRARLAEVDAGMGADELAEIGSRGVRAFADYLAEKIRRTNTAVTMGFTRCQSAIYGVRQAVIGNDEATRTTTSPVLAEVTRGSATEFGFKTDLIDFVDTLAPPTDGIPGRTPPLIEPPTFEFSVEDTGFLIRQTETLASSETFFLAETGDSGLLGLAGNLGDVSVGDGLLMLDPFGSLGAPNLLRLASTSASGPIEASIDSIRAVRTRALDALPPSTTATSTTTESTSAIPEVQRSAQTVSVGTSGSQGAGVISYVPPKRLTPFRYQTSTIAAEALAGFNTPVSEGVRLDFGNTGIAERVKDPAALVALDRARTARAYVTTTISRMDIFLEDTLFPGWSPRPSQVPQEPEGDDAEPTDTAVILRTEPTDLLAGSTRSRVLAGDPAAAAEVVAGYHDRDSGLDRVVDENFDEARYFQAAIRHLEDGFASLRLVERRLLQYQKAIELSRGILPGIEESMLAVRARLVELEDELAEVRHDVSVARLLLEEEIQRVIAINAERDEIVANHVPFVVFHRARTDAWNRGSRAQELYPELLREAVPDCLEDPAIPPPELRQLVDLWRDAPAAWFPRVRDSLPKIGQLNTLQTLLIQSVKRKAARVQYVVAKPSVTKASTVSRPLQSTLEASRTMLSSVRQRTAILDLTSLNRMSWKQAQVEAKRVLSLGDVVDGDGVDSKLTQIALEEMENILRVGACLHERLSQTEPARRLRWSQQVSQFDEAIDLENLGVLRSWNEVEYAERKALQELVDWLYDRVNPLEAEAVELVRELVRVCILLASHAPVDQIVSGSVTQDVPVRLGGRVDLAVDLTRIRVGMAVTLFQAERAVARAVVEDLGQGKATAQIVHAVDTNAVITPTDRVHVYDPDTGKAREALGGAAIAAPRADARPGFVLAVKR